MARQTLNRGSLLKGILLIMFLSNCACAWSQSKGVVTGRVLNTETNLPVPYATVFLAGTMIGTSSNEQGVYSLSNIPAGKYQLIVSCVGYKLKDMPVSLTGNTIQLDVSLPTDVQQLNEVVVKWDRSEYARLLNIFKTFFIGTTNNASQCTITNIADVDLDYDKATNTVTASCNKPLEIENTALGYRIYYLLRAFKVDYTTGFCSTSGIPRFQDLQPKSNSESVRRAKERERAYYGSINHFMRSLKNETLAKNEFSIYSLTHGRPQNDAKWKRVRMHDSLYYEQEIHDTDLNAKEYAGSYLLKIIYEGEHPETTYNEAHRIYLADEVSYLTFTKHKLVISDNGYYEDPLTYYADGYLGWTNKIAELLPLEYQPAHTPDQ